MRHSEIDYPMAPLLRRGRQSAEFTAAGVERWLVSGMEHAHSGGAAGQNWSDPKGPNAAVASYRFFMAHPMRPGRALRCR